MKVVLPIFSLVFLFIGAVSIFMTVHRVITNDSRLIGVLMSLGYRPFEVAFAYLAFGMVIAVLGIAMGAIFAYGFTFVILTATMQLLADIELVFPFDPYPFIVGAVYSVTATLAAVSVPVLAITRRTVREALEYKATNRVYASRRLFKNVSKVSAMGYRNALRNPLRAVFTIFAVGITIGAAGSWVFLIDSSLDYTFEQLEADNWDLRVDLISPVDAASLQEELGLEDATFVIPFTILTGIAVHGDSTMAGTLVGCDRMEEARDLELSDGKVDLNGAVVSHTLSRDLGIGVGEDLTVMVGATVLSIPVTGVVLTVMEGVIYTGRANLDPAFPSDMAMGAFVKVDGDAMDQRAEALRELPMVSKVVVSSEVSDSVEGLLSEFMSLYYTFFILSALMAFIVASSAVIVSAAEREVEYATLNTLGISMKGVSKAILAEMSILTLGSVVVGLPSAYLLSEYLAGVYQDLIYYFPIYLNLFPIAVTLTIGALFVMLASIVPIRYASRVDSERVLRERAAG